MTDHNKGTDQRIPWYIRLWVRLTARRASRAEIEAVEVTDEEVARGMAQLKKRGYFGSTPWGDIDDSP